MENIDLNLLFKLSYGLFLISSADGENESAFVGNTVMQVTSKPVQLAVCSNKNNFTTELIQKSKKLAVSVLDTGTPKEIIGLFGTKSGRDIDKFEGIKHRKIANNIPVISEHSIGWFGCDVKNEIDVGSHIIFIAEVMQGEILNNDSEPITYEYYRRVHKGKSPKNAPTYIENSDPATDLRSGIWVCDVCKYEYDPKIGDLDSGIAPGVSFEKLPESWTCPICSASKSDFYQNR
jgi:flavin reductase (DIM6/NTAB) family NADH-FMN oxidoreductase RutF/rubredoxin